MEVAKPAKKESGKSFSTFFVMVLAEVAAKVDVLRIIVTNIRLNIKYIVGVTWYIPG